VIVNSVFVYILERANKSQDNGKQRVCVIVNSVFVYILERAKTTVSREVA
jgi:uncharacterized membrane protein